MPIVDRTDYPGDVDIPVARWLERLERAVVHQLMYAAEACVAKARLSHTYRDRTGNLTSSIGAVVAVDGRVVGSTDFDRILSADGGPTDGREYATRIAAGFPGKIALVVVAGERYALYVSNRGYDVIDSAKLEARQILPLLMAQLSRGRL